ncbi:MAG: hypothetical protein H0Z34_15950 [Brevibacillus sp.]|nr:hypothetical protein [Brevibacillus sp.]
MTTILIAVILLAAVIGTLAIGLSPQEKDYGKKTKRNLTRLSWLYVVGTIIFIAIFIYGAE